MWVSRSKEAKRESCPNPVTWAILRWAGKLCCYLRYSDIESLSSSTDSQNPEGLRKRGRRDESIDLVSWHLILLLLILHAWALLIELPTLLNIEKVLAHRFKEVSAPHSVVSCSSFQSYHIPRVFISVSPDPQGNWGPSETTSQTCAQKLLHPT